jgi:hypothetical protein
MREHDEECSSPDNIFVPSPCNGIADGRELAA